MSTKKDIKALRIAKKQKLPLIRMTHEQFNSGALENAIVRFENAEVTSATACRLHQVVRVVRPLIISITEEFNKEVVLPLQAKLKAVMGLEPEDACPTREELQMADPEQKVQIELFQKEFTEQKKEFGERTVEFRLLPLAPQHLKEIKITAAEIGALGPLYDESGEGGRHEHFKGKLGLVES